MAYVKNPETGRYILVGGSTYISLKAKGVKFGPSSSFKRKARKTSTSPKKRKSSPKRKTSHKRKSSKKTHKSPTKYRHHKVHSSAEKAMKAKCGPTCFLVPKSMKYPVCKPDCSVDCKKVKKGASRLKKAGYKHVAKMMKAAKGCK